MFSLAKYKLYGVIAAGALAFIAGAYAAGYVNGKSSQRADQAEADTEAYVEGIADAADSWQRKLNRAVTSAKDIATKEANAKSSNDKVQEHVKNNFSIVKCYNATSLQHINKAIKDSRTNTQ